MPVRESALRNFARIDAIYLEDLCSSSRRIVDTWRERRSRSVVTESENSCAGWVYLRSTRSHAPRFKESIRELSVSGLCRLGHGRVAGLGHGITYTPLQKAFLYLVTIVDLFTINVYTFGEGFAYSWKLLNSLDTECSLEALEMALAFDRWPEIFRFYQGCQFTFGDFVVRLHAEEINISWSRRRRCYDNILVERLSRTFKYEEVNLYAHSDGWEAEIRLARFLWMYCYARPQCSLGGRTPHEIYTEIGPCSSRVELSMSGARTVQ